jgi:K+-transporting ATPase KdpF subunit
LASAGSWRWPHTPRCAGVSDAAMVDLILGGAVSGLLLVYLLWALIRPEDL